MRVITVQPVNNSFVSLLKSRGRQPLIIAHRGDCYHAPENTLEAAHLAWQAGAPAWELDVQLTRDGVPIVIHDDSLTRTTNVAARFADDPRGCDGYRVCDFDYDEIRTLDAGSWFVAADGGPRSANGFGTLETLTPACIDFCRSGSIVIPTLAEALRLTAELDWLVNIEIKSFPRQPPGLLTSVLSVVRESRTSERILISSFDHRDVVDADRSGREYALGILVHTPIHRLGEYAREFVRVDTVHVSTELLGSKSLDYRRDQSSSSLDARDVYDLRARDCPVLVYTVNDSRRGGLAQHLAEMGVHGLFTDDPHGLMNSDTVPDRYAESIR
jgi:glycerophosphoryl diester phosphodiesterase